MTSVATAGYFMLGKVALDLVAHGLRRTSGLAGPGGVASSLIDTQQDILESMNKWGMISRSKDQKVAYWQSAEKGAEQLEFLRKRFLDRFWEQDAWTRVYKGFGIVFSGGTDEDVKNEAAKMIRIVQENLSKGQAAVLGYDSHHAKMYLDKARAEFANPEKTPKSWREPEKTMLEVECSRITSKNFARSLCGRAKIRTGD